MGSSRDSGNRYSNRTPRGSRRVRVVRSSRVRVFDHSSYEGSSLGNSSFCFSYARFLVLCIALYFIILGIFIFEGLISFERLFYIG